MEVNLMNSTIFYDVHLLNDDMMCVHGVCALWLIKVLLGTPNLRVRRFVLTAISRALLMITR